MCGLVLVITKNSNGFSQNEQSVFRDLLFIDTLRGDDSTGVALIDNIGNVKLAKEACHGLDFIRTKEFDELKSDAWRNGWAMIGHNRKATRGDITDKNAHPFVVDDNIVLVHNGSYNGDHKKLKDVEVDSEAIAHTISETSNVQEALRKVNAAYALIWYNVDNKEINVIRNTQRPLWMMETHSSYIFASEKSFLEFAQKRNNLNILKEMVEIPEYTLFNFALNDNKTTTMTASVLDCSYYKHHQYTNTSTSTPNKEYPFRHWADSYEYYENWESCETESDKGHFRCNTNTGTGRPVLSLPNPNRKLILTTSEDSKELIKNYIAEQVQQRHRFGSYMRLANTLNTGTKLKVVVEDLVEADKTDPKTKDFFLIGKPINENYWTVFHLHEDNWDQLQAKMDSAVFEIDVGSVTWNRTDDSDSYDDDSKGLIIVHGKNPTPIYMQEVTENVQ